MHEIRHGSAAGAQFRPQSAFGCICSGVAGLACLYAVILAGIFKTDGASPAVLEWLSDWGAVPEQGAACALVAALLWRRPAARPYRLGWGLVLLFVVVNAIAAYVWNVWRPSGASREEFSFADLIYVFDYWLLTGACAVWFVAAGGSFRRARVWLDAVTLVAVLLLGLWSFFLGPTVGADTARSISFGAIFGYSTAIVCMMAMAGLLCLQLTGYRTGLPILLVVCGGLLDVIWEIMWMASWLTDRDFVSPFFNYGDVLCFTAICCGVALTQFETPCGAEPRTAEPRMDGFLPLLAVLVAIAVLSVSVASTRRWDAWMLNGLVAVCAVLLITRQQSARKEMRALNRELARREADARLIELVRRSADLIVVVSAAGRITFASPAAEMLLGRDPAQLHGTEAPGLFGVAQQPVLADLLERATHFSMPIGAEIRVQSAGGSQRVYKLSAINRLANPLIQGIVLTVTDVTEQRLLEREVLDVAARERVHLSGEIHDGLGQELVGIGMLLQGAASSRQTDSALIKGQLQELVGQINLVVNSARDLARGLSPLGVARGSLGGALRRLVPESPTAVRIVLDIDPAFDERVIEDFRADHLYRIAQEAVSNAIRHSGGSVIRIALRRVDTAVSLGIVDDGRGFDAPPAGYPGLGLRMMEYRARVMGGSLRFEHPQGAGTRIEVIVPVSATATSATS